MLRNVIARVVTYMHFICLKASILLTLDKIEILCLISAYIKYFFICTEILKLRTKYQLYSKSTQIEVS